MDKLVSTAPLEPRAHTGTFRLLEGPFLVISELQSSECGVHVCKPTGFLGSGQCPYAFREMKVPPITTGKLARTVAKCIFHRLSNGLVMCGLFALVHLTTAVFPLIPSNVEKLADKQ